MGTEKESQRPATVIIPARFDSSRFPGKVLERLAGRPIIQHVCEAVQQGNDRRCIVATDSPRVADAVRAFGTEAMMTSDQHQSGSDRVCEVVDQLDFDDDELVINVQGDEPLMPVSVVDQVEAALRRYSECDIATACLPIEETQEYYDPNAVKVVFDARGFALYFSRAAIPADRALMLSGEDAKLPASGCWRHVGIYGFRAGALRRFSRADPVALETTECLEQLRALHAGMRIHVSVASERPGPGIDTPEDLQRVEQLLSAKQD